MNVFLDGDYAFSLSLVLAARLKLKQELAEADVQQLLAQDAVETAYERTLYYLSFRPRSEREIRRYLHEKGVDGEPMEEVLARLQRSGLVNDQEFARSWVENREHLRPRGRLGLRAELRQKGIADEAIESALADVDEETSAMNAARRYACRLAGLDEPTFRHRLLGFLQRRGFNYATARQAAVRLWQENQAQQGMEPE